MGRNSYLMVITDKELDTENEKKNAIGQMTNGLNSDTSTAVVGLKAYTFFYERKTVTL